MNDRFRCRIVSGGVAALVALGLAGCGPGRGDVSGTVSYKGQKIPLGRITLQSQGGRMESFSGAIEDGQYTIKGVPAGPAKVAVETYGSAGETPPPKGIPKSLLMPPKEGAHAAKKLPIPPRYADVAQSGLSYEVQPGPQTKNFNLD